MKKQRRIMITASAVSLIAGMASMNAVLKHSQVRNVDVVALAGCGICMGVFIANIVRPIKMKRLNNIAE